MLSSHLLTVTIYRIVVAHFVKTIGAIRYKSPETTVEILPGDFRGKQEDIDSVTRAKPDVFNLNLETVPRLYRASVPVRYFRSLRLLERVKEVTRRSLQIGYDGRAG